MINSILSPKRVFKTHRARSRSVSMQHIIAVNSNCYHGYSIEEAIEGISAAGFRYIELTATRLDRTCLPDHEFCLSVLGKR